MPINIPKSRNLTCIYQTGYTGKSPLKLSYGNSFVKERSSAVGRGAEAEVCGFETYLQQISICSTCILPDQTSSYQIGYVTASAVDW